MGSKVVHLTSAHDAGDVRILHRQCQTLTAAGYDVVLIAPGEDPGAEGALAATDFAGVRLHPVPPARSRRGRMTRTVWKVGRAALAEAADLYHLHDPELLPVGLLLRLLGRRVIYDAHEDLPRQILAKDWLPCWLRPPVALATACFEAVAARCLSGVVAATPAIARRFPRRGTALVQNFPPCSEFAAGRPHSRRAPLIAYTGGISRHQGAAAMLAAVARLPERLRARLIIAGTFAPPELEGEIRRQPGWRRVVYRGWQPRAGVRAILARARVGLVVDQPIPNYLDSYSTKLFEYMAAGLPVVASDFPLWREIVDGAGCGLLVNPEDPTAIAAALQYLLERPKAAAAMGRRGRAAVLQRYNWEQQAARLLALYARLGVV